MLKLTNLVSDIFNTFKLKQIKRKTHIEKQEEATPTLNFFSLFNYQPFTKISLTVMGTTPITLQKKMKECFYQRLIKPPPLYCTCFYIPMVRFQ